MGCKSSSERVICNQGFKSGETFIVTQGPMEETVQDFWTMIWMNGVEKVVMLTKLEEKGQSAGNNFIQSNIQNKILLARADASICVCT